MNKFINILFIISIFSCGQEDESIKKQVSGKFISHNAKQIGIEFVNQIEESEEVNGLTWDAIYSGGGVGIGDINNDGFADVFFAGNQTDDALYLNNGDFTFTDISESSGINNFPGWSSGVSMVDINADGFLDIYVCRNSWKMDNDDPDSKRNKFFLNNGDNTFSESAKALGLDHQGYSTQATFLDFDKDGDLDMFLLNTPSNNLKQKVAYVENDTYSDWISDQFFLNHDGHFHNATKDVGVSNFSFGLGVVAADINHDTWVDIYVANDYERPDYLYINQRDGTFKNELNQKIKHTSFTSMGCDAADINNDGLTDIGVVDMQSADHVRSKTNMPSMDEEQFWSYVKSGYNHQYMTNVLQVNSGVGFFSDIAQYAGISSTDWSWAILMADYNNDSHKDIFISNGINRDLRNNDFSVEFTKLNEQGERINLLDLSEKLPSSPLSNFMYSNHGDFEFDEVSATWGLEDPSFSFGAAYGDLDNDGDLDLIVNNNNGSPFIYENELSNGNYLKFDIKGGQQNPMSFGTKIFAYSEDQIFYQELNPVRGYQSSCEPNILIGLGERDKIDSVICYFPDKKTIVKRNISANQTIQLDYKNALNIKVLVYKIDGKIFNNQTIKVGFDFVHREDSYDDYAKEVLLPHSQTRVGPKVAIGDLNGDGIDDVFVCGAAGQAGQIFIQSQEGTFTKRSISIFNKHKSLEDVDAVIADFDQDGNNDLYVQSGGGAGTDVWQDRLYKNDGKGNFSWSDELSDNSNGACIATADFDGDGDLDIFLGGRGEPLKYPYPGTSSLLLNENGKFQNVIEDWAPELKKVGMVTDAQWADVSGDGKLDLIVVGEWMQPTAFIQVENGFEKDSNWFSNANEHKGWWFSIEQADLNNDGLQDFILGNVGENNKFHPSVEKPLQVYSSDFDDNSSNDIVLAKDYKGKTVPTRGRECSSEQLPFIAEEFETFESFANASLENILGEKLDDALVLEVNNFKSGVILSSAEGYEFKAFPSAAQISPVMGSVVYDFDKDGLMDILIAGNLFDAEVETTRHDSGNGLLLKGKEDLTFEPIGPLNSGFYAPTNVRGLSLALNNAYENGWILVPANNNRLTAFSFKK